jgi:hypothetical protein
MLSEPNFSVVTHSSSMNGCSLFFKAANAETIDSCNWRSLVGDQGVSRLIEHAAKRFVLGFETVENI